MDIIKRETIDKIESVLTEEIIGIGVDCVLVIDGAGNLIANCDNGKCEFDIYALAALAAGSFGAVNAMAKVVGEEDFSLLFHKGKKESLHFSKINENLIIVSIFGKDISLGLLRLKLATTIEQIREAWEKK